MGKNSEEWGKIRASDPGARSESGGEVPRGATEGGMRRSGEECRGVRWSEMELKGLDAAVGIFCHGNPSRGANLQNKSEEWGRVPRSANRQLVVIYSR